MGVCVSAAQSLDTSTLTPLGGSGILVGCDSAVLFLVGHSHYRLCAVHLHFCNVATAVSYSVGRLSWLLAGSRLFAWQLFQVDSVLC